MEPDPQLLILGEPTSGLDPAGRKEVLDLIISLKQAGKTIFLSSHILPEVEQICDRVVIIDRGRLLRAGRLGELLAAGSRIEIFADQLPADLERVLAQSGAHVDRGPHGIRLFVEASRQRETIETFWAAGCDVLRVNPVKDSLEGLFLNVVEHRGGAS